MKSKFPKQYVAAGSYVVSEAKDEILEAYLGSCLGVTLCDPTANVGGLIHLLLPEPISDEKPWRAESYATIGLPLFIQALCDAGAREKRLKACIAGGALVGPTLGQNLDLDIGGRTTEVVQTILRQKGIPVSKAETGGYFSCRLSLNLRTWKSVIQPIGHHTAPVSPKLRKPTLEEIDRMVHRVRPIPQIAFKILRMIHDSHYRMQDVAKDVRQDQIISARVIKLCNSAFVSPKNKIDSIDRALVILGEKLLLGLVVSASMESYFPESRRGYSLCKGGLYQHALGTARIAQELAKFTGVAPPDIAYTAGLLHDIGKVVLDQYVASAYPFFYRRTQMDGIDLCEAETEKFGITHAEAGERLADRWSLPETLTDTIRHHHNPEQSTVYPELTHLVYLADLLMSRFRAGHELECLNTDALAMRLQKVGLSQSQFPKIVDLIPRQVLDASRDT
ncbi:MAG: HDOD domain-containing protein [Deltaproteobacteria bacterium]|nr:HDOD domain-containing protein [Deltaproteobacteria bacterium]